MIISHKQTEETAEYVLVVRGFAPELCRGAAFRRAKHFATRGKKILRCPYCGEVFETIDSTIKVELYRHTRGTSIACHTSIPCGICRNKIGIIYASA
ncbi:MAG: hypothetical protein LBS18_00755 [Clostridiales bacterium]|nr:hypothetical protein [Clostridiales bacterium]